ncbi:MAG: ABC transporter permease [Proteobacteria bacterium]|nr:ABC transporter permease [Pseudomonadota bacterium]
MNRVFLIARQEFIKFVTRRGFLFTLIGVPLWIGLAAIVPKMIASGGDRAVFTVVDHGHGFKQEIARTLAHESAQRFIMVDAPKNLLDASPKDFAFVASDYFSKPHRVSAEGDVAKLDAIVVIPPDFGARPAEFWSTSAEPHLRDFVQAALTKALRLRAAHKLGDAAASAALDVEAKLAPRNPAAASRSGSGDIAGVSVSIVMAILLLIVAMMNSMALLQGVIEEKSTRMIEVLLSCATPWEIIGGKIVGVIAVALFTIVLWVGSAAVLGSLFAQSQAGAMTHAALTALSNPVLAGLIVLYFLSGLLIYGAVFLTIGSMSASLADAQAYLGPSMMIIMLPNLFIAAILNAPNGTLATAASYFPIYTPYIMLMRVGSHPPTFQLVSTALLSVSVAALLIWKAGQTFARHALTTEKLPKLKRLFGWIRENPAA